MANDAAFRLGRNARPSSFGCPDKIKDEKQLERKEWPDRAAEKCAFPSKLGDDPVGVGLREHRSATAPAMRSKQGGSNGQESDAAGFGNCGTDLEIIGPRNRKAGACC